MVKTYLKQVCNLEAEIEEKNLKLEKTISEVGKAKERIKKEKQERSEKIAAKKSDIVNLKEKIAERKKYEPKTLTVPIWTCIGLLALTVAICAAFYCIIVDMFGATTAAEAILAYTAIYFVIVFLAWAFDAWIDGIAASKTIISVIIILVCVFLSWGYLAVFESMGIAVSKALIIFDIFLIIIELIIDFFVIRSKERKNLNEYSNNKKATRNYNAQLAEEELVLNELNNDNERYISDANNAIKLMDRDVQIQKNALEALRTKLRQLYSQNVLHPNYQHWVAAATIYEYLDVGRCYELKGPDGAYNLYEKELIAKKILASLDAINTNIGIQGNRISNSQMYIRNQLQECNRKLDNYVVNTYKF